MDERDQKLLAAIADVATELRILRVILTSVIAPAARNAEGLKVRPAFLRTEEED